MSLPAAVAPGLGEYMGSRSVVTDGGGPLTQVGGLTDEAPGLDSVAVRRQCAGIVLPLDYPPAPSLLLLLLWKMNRVRRKQVPHSDFH